MILTKRSLKRSARALASVLRSSGAARSAVGGAPDAVAMHALPLTPAVGDVLSILGSPYPVGGGARSQVGYEIPAGLGALNILFLVIPGTNREIGMLDGAFIPLFWYIYDLSLGLGLGLGLGLA